MFIRVCLLMLLALSQAFAQEDETTAVASPPSDSITFTYDILEPKMAEPVIEAAGSTIYMKVYFVEVACSDFAYGFERRGDTLVVSHTVEDVESCEPDEDQIYGVEASLANVSPGTYIIRFQFVKGPENLVVFDHMIKVKRPASK
jgi:hypothetical protein